MEENKNKQEEMENRDAVELTEQEEQSVTGGGFLNRKAVENASIAGKT